MRLEWLEDILAVAETGSLSEAAERRHLTQSAFSRRIQTIEDHVGVELFDRGRKPVHLRHGTQLQREQMQRLAHDLHQLVEELRQGERQARNRLVMAAQHALATALAPTLIRRIHQQRGDVQVRLRSANRDECLALVLAREVDVAIFYERPGMGETTPWRSFDYLEHHRLGQDQLVPVATARIAGQLRRGLASGAEIELPVIAYPSDVFLGRVMALDIRPRLPPSLTLMPRVETALTTAAFELAAEGQGMVWLPRLLFKRLGPGRDLQDLSDLLPSCRLDMIALQLLGRDSDSLASVWALLRGFGVDRTGAEITLPWVGEAAP